MTADLIKRMLVHADEHGDSAVAIVAVGYALLEINGQLERIADAFQAKPAGPADLNRVTEAGD